VGDLNFAALDTDDVAALLGVSDRMVRIYLTEKGMPCKGDGRGRRFVWADVLEWYVAYRLEMAGNDGRQAARQAGEEDLEQATTRKTIAEADLKELELASKRGEVVAVADIEAAIAKVSKNIQQKLLAVPAKLTSRLVGTTDRNRINAVLDVEMRNLCSELSTINLQPAPDSAAAEAEA